jgi:hypothetical protein
MPAAVQFAARTAFVLAFLIAINAAGEFAGWLLQRLA